MRITTIATAAVLVFAAFGCSPPPKELVVTQFVRALNRHFNNMNNESESRKAQMARAQILFERNPSFPRPTGTTFSTYHFNVQVRMEEVEVDERTVIQPVLDENSDPVIDQGFVVQEFKCMNEACGARLLLVVPSQTYLCPSCGHCPYREHLRSENLLEAPCRTCVGDDGTPQKPEEDLIAQSRFTTIATLPKNAGMKVKDMFQLTEVDPEKPLKATVRWIRRTWNYDERGAVLEYQKEPHRVLERAGVSESELLPGPGGTGYGKSGYHRLDSQFLGEQVFVFAKGQLRSVGKPVETPVRPWKDIRIPPDSQ